MTHTIQHVHANGLRFAFFSEGEGPLVLLLHGFPDTAHTWDHVRPLLAKKGYRAVSPFMRGYAPTEVPTRDPDGEQIARDALALIEALGEKQAIVIGHDWGASAAYGAASLGPERVSKLFTVGIPHPGAVKPSLKLAWGVRHFAAYKLPGAGARFARDDFAALRSIYKRWSPKWTPPEQEFAPIRAAFSERKSLESAFGYYRTLSLVLPEFMRRPIAVDTVAFAGLDDPAVGPADYEGARRMFSREYHVEAMPGGHFLHREHPELFAEKLLRYL
jgi:pimeloyl-ACP methyl ester carboxylesterase